MQQQWDGTLMLAPPEHLKCLPITLCGFKIPTHPHAADAWGVGMLSAEVRPARTSLGSRVGVQLPHVLLNCGEPI